MLIWIHLAHFEVISRPSPPFSTSGFRACVTHIRRDAILKKEEAFFEPFQTSRSLPKTRRIKKRTRIHSTASMKWLMFVLMNFWNCQLWVDNSENHSTLGSFAVKSTVIYIYPSPTPPHFLAQDAGHLGCRVHTCPSVPMLSYIDVC